MQTKNLISYIIEKLDGQITTTKLVKLLYLMDVEYYRKTKKKLTDFEWFYYHYGPYPKAKFQEYIEELVAEKKVFIEKKKAEKPFMLYHYIGEKPSKLSGSNKAILIVNRIISEYGSFSLNALLDYVYHTTPFEGTKNNEKIDFSKLDDSLGSVDSFTELEGKNA